MSQLFLLPLFDKDRYLHYYYHLCLFVGLTTDYTPLAFDMNPGEIGWIQKWMHWCWWKKICVCMQWLVCTSDHNLMQIGIEILIFGTICSYSHKVSSKGSNIVTNCIYGCIMSNVAWTHRCVQNDMLSFGVCGLIHSPSDSALVLQLALRNTLPQIPVVGAEHWTPPLPRTCLFVIPQCTGK